jgi:hypothetical protein
LGHGQGGVGQVDVDPAQADEFAPAQPAQAGQPPQAEQIVIGDRGQKDSQQLGCPDAIFGRVPSRSQAATRGCDQASGRCRRGEGSSSIRAGLSVR